MKPIAIGIGGSNFDVFKFFAENLADAFGKLDKKAFIIDFEGKNLQNRLLEAFKVQPGFFLSINSIGSDLFFSLFNLLKLPFFSLMVDNPIYHVSRLDGKIEHHVVGYVDRSYIRYHQANLPKHLKSVFLPHAGSYCPYETKDMEFGERPIPVLFTGSYWDLRYFEQILSEMPAAASGLAGDAIDICLASDCLPIDIALEKALEQKRIRATNPQDILKLLVLISNYIRAFRRQQCLRLCSQGDYPIHVYGDNWDRCPFKDRLNIHGPVDFPAALKLMTQAKIVLNISAVVPEGSHERVFSSMLNGAVSLTDKNDYFSEEFTEEKNILFYSWKNPDALPEKINQWLANPEKLAAIARAGKHEAMNKHTWLHRAKTILKKAFGDQEPFY